MAGPNSFQQSPFQALIDKQPAPLPGSAPVKETEVPDLSDDDAPAAPATPTPAAAPAPRAASPASLLPPESMRPLFEATAAHFNVPVNVLMAISQQESSYNPDAVNPASGASGAGGYMDATAKSLRINARDPNEAVPAIAQQLRERLDKGYSMQDAVNEHFAGPDRKLWGPKTAAYGQEVLAKAGQIGQELYGDSSDAQQDAPTAGPEQNQFAPNRMARADYEKEFRALNPKASDAAVANVMAQYDQQAAARLKAANDKRAAGPVNPIPTPEEFFDQRLNAKLQGPQNGVVPQLPARQQPVAFPETGTPDAAPSTFDTVAGNLTGGTIGTLVGAIAGAAHLVGADDAAKEWDDGLEQIRSRQKELGGDTFAGKTASLIGGIVPALSAAPESKVLEFAKNAGLFGVPAFQETYKAKLAEGQSNRLALVHAFEAFGMNTLAPLVMQHGMGAVIGKLGAEGAAGVKGAALGLGQAATEGVGFSAANTVMDKGTDVLAGQQNDRPWIDPEDMAVQAAGFGGLRGAHMVGHAVGEAISPHADPAAQAADAARADALARWQNDGLSPNRPQVAPTGHVDPTMGDAPPVDQAKVDAAVARADAAAKTGASVADQLRAIRPTEPAGPLESAVEHAANSPTTADAGPMSAAIDQAAAQHEVDPAPAPEMPSAPPDYTAMPLDDLRAALKDVAGRAQQQPDQRKALMAERRQIEQEITARGKQAKADSKPAVEPLSAGPFDDMGAANKMMSRYAEETGVPHEVVGSEGKFKVQPIEGQGNGIDTAGTERGTDGRGRSGGPADAVGSDIAAGRAGAGTGTVEGERAGSGLSAEKRGADAGDHRAGADGAADAKPALIEHPQTDDELYAHARELVTKTGNPSVSLVQRHLRVGYNRAARMMERMEADGIVSPMAPNGARTILAKENAHVPERPQVPEEETLARGAQGEKPAAAGDRTGADAGAGAAPAAEGKLAARRALNDKQDAVVRAAAEKLAARKAEKDAAEAAPQPAAEAPAREAGNPARDVPLSFMKKVKVDHDVYIRDEGRWETTKVPAHVALKSVREDIGNLEALLNCMKG